MKKFLAILILILTLQAPSYAAEDIRSFQIEGISVGDSLLDYYSLEKQKEMKTVFDEKTSLVSIIISDPSFRTYDQIQVVFIKKNQKILSIEGLMHHDNYEFCLSRKSSVINEILRIFPNKKLYEVIDEKEKLHPIDKSEKSKYSTTYINLLDKKGSINVRCYDWSDELTKKKGWIDSLSVSINSEKIKTLKKIVNVISEPLPIIIEANKFKFPNEKYYALLIGNNDYEYWEKLEAPVNDVVEIGKILESKYGYVVDVVKNANSNTIITKLIELSKKVTNEDNLLIYYSGHGDRNINMSPIRAYWIPTDASQTFDAKWINTENVTAIISQITAKHVLIMVDSCFAGSSIKGTSTTEADIYLKHKDFSEKYMAKMLTRRTRQIITSGNIEPVVDSYIQNHSLFAYKFLDVLKKNENYITSRALYGELHKYIVQASSQNPQFSKLKNMGDIDGEFFFIVKN